MSFSLFAHVRKELSPRSARCVGLHDARGHPQRGADGGQYRQQGLHDEFPKVFFHGSLVFLVG